MNRKNFFKTLLGVTVGVAVAPKMIAEVTKEPDYKKAQMLADADLNSRMYPYPPQECYESYYNGIDFWYDFSRCIRIKRNGFYAIGDVFYTNQRQSLFIVKHMDENYCYCYPV